MLKEKIREIQSLVNEKCREIGKEQWYQQFSVGYSDTLEKTVTIDPDSGRVFILTGDIPAMWLRDSVCQVLPYLFPAKTEEAFAELLGNLVTTQSQYILKDPYANAFNQTPNGAGHQTDKTVMGPWIWERKFEIDSLCYPVFLAYQLYQLCGYKKHFDDTFYQAVKEIIRVFEIEQNHEESEYSFERIGERREDTLTNGGRGTPVAKTGMIWSGFRPSDDACHFGYLIPSNMFAVVILKELEEIMALFYDDTELFQRIQRLRAAIDLGIETYGIVKDPTSGKKIYAYEVDGYGNYLLMDDANVPSLMSIPYLGYCSNQDPIYKNTRAYILSKANPYYYEGKFAKGIGSSHTPEGYIWPIALAVQGLTAEKKQEKEYLLDMIVNTDNNTKQCHESLDVNDPSNYTREWFSWSNMMFCQLVLDYFELR